LLVVIWNYVTTYGRMNIKQSLRIGVQQFSYSEVQINFDVFFAFVKYSKQSSWRTLSVSYSLFLKLFCFQAYKFFHE